MDIFFVGAFYDVAVSRRAFRWLVNLSVLSQVAVLAMSGAIVLAHQIARTLVAKRSR